MKAGVTDTDDDPIVLVPIPMLMTQLVEAERMAGRPLTEDEVLAIRDNATCLAMPRSVRDEVAAERGYEDVSIDDPWRWWSLAREISRAIREPSS
jgi:hypothetical protein